MRRILSFVALFITLNSFANEYVIDLNRQKLQPALKSLINRSSTYDTVGIINADDNEINWFLSEECVNILKLIEAQKGLQNERCFSLGVLKNWPKNLNVLMKLQ